ncbi:MAG TPA: T9SS type A sorting domain-containing protein, partial [Saprospiraceae bacterium]|nr:T9SS type A sorting domain-containing protein [Saprospiraceae bacterium]
VLLTSNTYNEGVLRLVDTKGHTVYHEKMSLSIGDHYINLDVDGNLPPGMYILTLTDGRGVKSAKLIKQ